MKVWNRVRSLVFAAVLISVTVPCGAQATVGTCPVTGGDLAQLMKVTKVDFVPGWNRPESQFRETKDPGMLQIVELSDKKDGPNGV